MFTLKSRVIATAAAAAVALSVFGLSPAAADGFYPPAVEALPPPKPHYVYPYGYDPYLEYRRDDVAAAAAAAVLLGTIATIVETRRYRHRYYVYDDGPVYRGHGPRGRHWRHAHHYSHRHR